METSGTGHIPTNLKICFDAAQNVETIYLVYHRRRKSIVTNNHSTTTLNNTNNNKLSLLLEAVELMETMNGNGGDGKKCIQERLK